MPPKDIETTPAKQTLDAEAIKQQALALGFHAVGIAAIDELPTAAEQRAQKDLQTWLTRGYQADMGWMESDRRQDIRKVMPTANAIICVALNYYTEHERPVGEEFAKISRYGWGRDYHRVMTQKLKQLVAWLQTHDAAIEARLYADTGPVQDKFWAQQAGLGWIAKNGNLINRQYGSWVFLGEVITNLTLSADRPHTAHCGSCTRCLSACPTDAIRAPGIVDANRCIAYHTIENRAETLPAAIAQNLQGWVAGCDICQDVCPWNQRFAQKTDVADFEPYPQNIAPRLDELTEISEAEWNKRFPASALRRIKPPMLRRNARAAAQKGADEQTS
ncbi:MAG: tRNA epoxyqueuosine(34) reductase QueG [Cyanobacteria bacterium P01_D01_bin.105]